MRGFKPIRTAGWGRIIRMSLGILLPLFGAPTGFAATFTNNANIRINDPTSSLTATGTTYTVSCWFRMLLPSSMTLGDNMTIFMDRTDGNESANFSCLIRYNISSNVVEFVTRGSSGTYSQPLIQTPFLNRWYHVAVSRSGSIFNAYVDGHALQPGTSSIGTATGSGIAIGGINGNSKQFYGDIVEVAIYPTALSLSSIQNGMFKDQRNFPNIRGYYKLGASTNQADYYHNFVPTPPSGTDPAVATGTGQITFASVDEAGEQSLFDANLNHGENAATPLSGAFAWNQTAFSRPVPGIAFDFEYGYSSALPTVGQTLGQQDPYDVRVLGPKWRNTFDLRVVEGATVNELDLVNWDGSVDAWTRTNLFAPLFTKHHEYHGEMQQLQPSGEVLWMTPTRIKYLFRDPTITDDSMAGRLEQIQDLNGNTVTLQWDLNAFVVTNVIDTAGGSYRFLYDPSRQFLLTNVVFGQWQVIFGYDSTNRLASKLLTNSSGLYGTLNTLWQFQYDTNGLLSQIIDPRGNTNLYVQYDQYGRQTNEMDALNRSTQTEYNVPNLWQVRHTDPGSNQWVDTFDTKGHLVAKQDPLLNSSAYAYDTNGNRTTVTEPMGSTTYFGYDTNGNMIANTNGLGEVTRWVFDDNINKPLQQITPQPVDANGWVCWTNFYQYDVAGNLTNHYDALGSLVSYSYFTNGLVSNSTDANGNVSQFSYDTNGFLFTQTDPATNTTTFARNDTGWKLAEIDALGHRTAYTYDLNGNVLLTVDPIFRQFTKTYDANGNLLSASDARGNLTRFGYDPANQKTNMVDRTGTNVWQYTYTSRGKLERAINPLGFTTTNVYDRVNRLARVSDPLGNTSTNVFDGNGNCVALFDALGQRWTKTYDRLNRVISEADPQGNIRQTTFDNAGRIKTVTSPNSFVTTHNYDGRGRLTKLHDAEGFDWLYAYDGNANITNITDALGGHYIMAYGSRNERILERNQDNFQWQYTYDELLRLKSQTDPNTLKRTVTYDNAGRTHVVDFTSSRQDTCDYDDNNNLKALTRRVAGVSTTTGFNYDLLDRVTQVTDPFYNTVNYGYDSLSRITSLVYPDGKTLQQRFDPLSRLTNQVDWAGRTTTYAYDSAGRLISRTYPNGIVQTNTFDNAGRITGLCYAPSIPSSNSINVVLGYAYDHNGNKIGGGEHGTFAWPMPSLIDETSRFTAGGRITNRVDSLNATNNFTYQFDASGNMTNVSGGGQAWALTYDEDNRTMSIHWQVLPLTDKLITNRYDALGRRVSRVVDGVETHYVLDLQGSMERVLCDSDSGGNITAWYVHGPDLCYRVDVTNGLTCFHADAQANVIALTDDKTNLVAQYAYTPYGRGLGSTNYQPSIPQSFLFVGSQGVMEELPGLYFMRARYYSADAGVFLSTDPVKKVGPGWKPTLFSYSGQSPLTQSDPNGELFIVDDIAFLAVGTVVGIGDRVIEDTILGQPSSWQTYVASAWGGAVGSEVTGNLEYSGNPILAGAVGGAASAFACDTANVGLNLLSGRQDSITRMTLNDLANDMTEEAIQGTLTGGLNKFVPISGLGKGLGGNVLGSVLHDVPGIAGGAVLDTYTQRSSLNIGSTSANQMCSYTASAIAPAAMAITAATSAQPSRPASGGGTTTVSGGNSPSITYTVRLGDTLGNIGYANGTTATALGAANGIQNLNLIHPGQVLTIPRR